MELRQIWRVIWKRLWIPVLLVVVVAGVSLFTRQPPPTTYTSSLRFTVGVALQEATANNNEDTYFAWLASEHLADDLSVVVSSQMFAADVTRHLAAMGSTLQVPPGSISGVTIAEKQHRILQLNLAWGNPDELTEIGQATVVALKRDSPKYFAQFGTPDALISVIDEPGPPTPVPPTLTQRLDLPVRLLVALVAGIALVFLLDYLDTSIRNSAELEGLDVSVLAELPKHRGPRYRG